MYSTTEKILKVLSTRMSKGGLIVFDEGNLDLKKSGESRALKEFLIDNRKNFKKKYLKKLSTRCLFRKNQINEKII